jgi:caffeoyl-CoA O-methyltransferase
VCKLNRSYQFTFCQVHAPGFREIEVECWAWLILFGESAREEQISILSIYQKPSKIDISRYDSFREPIEAMEIMNKAIESYLQGLLPPREAVLQEMERVAAERDFPIIGPLVGRLLCQLAQLTRARRVFELGSGFGYSAVWFARGISSDGRIICTDGSEENARQARQFFAQAGIAAMVDYRVGDALSLLEEEPGPLDIILNDIDKHEYPRAFEKAVSKLKKGGLLITDNTLWHGRVVTVDQSPSTLGVLKFNQMAYTSPQAFTTIIPLRDGVAVSMRI